MQHACTYVIVLDNFVDNDQDSRAYFMKYKIWLTATHIYVDIQLIYVDTPLVYTSIWHENYLIGPTFTCKTSRAFLSDENI